MVPLCLAALLLLAAATTACAAGPGRRLLVDGVLVRDLADKSLPGTVPSDPLVLGFDGQEFFARHPASAMLRVVSSKDIVLDAWLKQHPNPAVSGNVIQRLVLDWHDRLAVSIGKGGKLQVMLNGERVAPGTWTAVNGGSLRYTTPAWGAARQVTVQQPGVLLRISQPFFKAAGAHMPWLDCWVTLTHRQGPLGGLLAGTVPPDGEGPLTAGIVSSGLS